MRGNSFFGFSGGGGGTPPPTTDSWLLDGNTNGAEKYFGTNDNYSIPIYTNGAAIGIFLNTGDFGFGTVLPTSRVHIKGVDSTSSNYALKADNSATSPLFSVRNDGNIYIGSLLGSYKMNMVTDVSNMVLFETSQNLGYVVLNAVTNPTYRLLLNSVYAAEFGQNSSGTYIDKNGTLTLGSTNSGGQWTRVIGSGTDIYIGQSAFVKFGYASAACSFIEQDANTPLGIGTFLNQELFFFTNNTRQVTVLGSGNVGFGIAVPTAKAHIQGIDATSANYSLKVDNSASSPLLYVRNDQKVLIATSSQQSDGINEMLTIKAASNSYFPMAVIGNGNNSYKASSLFTHYDTVNKSMQFAVYGTTYNNGNREPMGGGYGLRIADDSASNNIFNLFTNNSSGIIFLSAGDCLFSTASSSVPDVPNIKMIGGGLSMFGSNATPTATIHSKGSDSTSSNFSFKSDNSSSTPLLYIRNDGNTGNGIATPLSRFHNFGIDSTTNSNQRLEPVTNVTEDTTGNTVGTTDATANVTAQTIEVPTDKVVSIESTIVYRKTAGAGVGTVGDGTTIKLNSSVKNVSGTLTLDTVQNTYTGTTNAIAGVSATYTISGTNVLVSVTGVVNDNITWNVITKVNTVA